MNLITIGLIIGAVLTVFVLTYIIGDNFLFRLAVYILIGASAAYAAVVVIFDVLWQSTVTALAQCAAQPGMLVIVVIGSVFWASWCCSKCRRVWPGWAICRWAISSAWARPRCWVARSSARWARRSWRRARRPLRPRADRADG